MKATNELGYTFELDEGLTEYAQEEQPQWNGKTQKGLPKNIVVLKITKENEFYGYILFNTKTQEQLSNELGLEEMGCKIDVMRFANNIKEREKEQDISVDDIDDLFD